MAIGQLLFAAAVLAAHGLAPRVAGTPGPRRGPAVLSYVIGSVAMPRAVRRTAAFLR